MGFNLHRPPTLAAREDPRADAAGAGRRRGRAERGCGLAIRAGAHANR